MKAVLFTDDVTLFFSNPTRHLKAVLQMIIQFGKFSGYSININKSEILEIGLSSTSVTWSELGLNIKIAPNHTAYLGIKIGKSPDTLYNLNYSPLIEKILTNLKKWSHLPLTLLGRCHLVRLMGFSGLLYPMQTLLLLIKQTDTTRLNSAVVKFL